MAGGSLDIFLDLKEAGLTVILVSVRKIHRRCRFAQAAERELVNKLKHKEDTGICCAVNFSRVCRYPRLRCRS